jgi:sulfoxide reductase heme-binding subunit YedZ
MRKKFLNKTLITILVVSGFICTPVYAQPQNDTDTNEFAGAEEIFELIGIEMPQNWEDWQRSRRHEYLRELGAIPTEGSKYRGEINLDVYFSLLGVDQPDNWFDMSFEDRKDFISTTKNAKYNTEMPTETEQNQADVSITETDSIATKESGADSESLQEKSILNTLWLLLFFTAVILTVLNFTFVRIFKYLKQHLTMYSFLKFSAYVVLPLVLIYLSIAFPQRSTFIYFGKASEYLLAYLLMIKPLGKIFNIKFFITQLSFRRQMGIMTFWLALFHSVMFIYLYEIYEISKFTDVQNFRFYGAVSMIGLCILAVTSNNFAVRTLKKYWKRLHRLVYLIFLFLLIHSSLAGGEYLWRAVLGVTYFVLKVLEFKGVRFNIKEKNEGESPSPGSVSSIN